MTRLSCSPSSLVRAALLLTVVAISTRTADAGFQTSAGTVGAGVNLSGGPDAMTANFQAVQSSFADHALAQLSFDAPLGCATVITHACSAPPMAGVPACCAQGVSNIAQVTLGYTITSETLPIGTPVTVMVCAATARMTMASYAAPKSGPGFGDFSDAGLYISLNVGGAQFVGTAYQLAYDKSPPGKEVFTGLYGEPASEQSVMLIRQVGDSFGLNVTFVGSARSQAAVVGASADGRSSSSLLWGAAIVDAPAQIRSVDDNSLFPSALGCTAKAAVEALPPMPNLGACDASGNCPTGYSCRTAPGDCDGEGSCLPIPQDCPKEYEPVCGCDGETFWNACDAAASGVSIAYLGECGSPCAADLNGDREVSVEDLVMIIVNWGCDGLCGGDINQDGVVDVLDLVGVVTSWGPC